ncbi:hypothetical protein CEXT_229471 [Caerostris extrusa]|uniref:Uncharacterized protein n=1 Tax=Caerostris extrusa TaxID=172846 RepID=A0AAV4XAZ3_CAEEX|nr:hypothetical protein CEXT_229471 [Caerostris extrusa]
MFESEAQLTFLAAGRRFAGPTRHPRVGEPAPNSKNESQKSQMALILGCSSEIECECSLEEEDWVPFFFFPRGEESKIQFKESML